MTQPASPRFEFEISPEVEVGVYASFVNIWHFADGFVLDFSALTQPPQATTDATGAAQVRLPARIVSRVRIPPQQAWEIMRALEAQLTLWEKENGRPAGSAPA